MRNVLQVFLGLFGVVAISIPILHVRTRTSVDSGIHPGQCNDGSFYATHFTGYGAALRWCVRGRRTEEPRRLFPDAGLLRRRAGAHRVAFHGGAAPWLLR